MSAAQYSFFLFICATAAVNAQGPGRMGSMDSMGRPWMDRTRGSMFGGRARGQYDSLSTFAGGEGLFGPPGGPMQGMRRSFPGRIRPISPPRGDFYRRVPHAQSHFDRVGPIGMQPGMMRVGPITPPPEFRRPGRLGARRSRSRSMLRPVSVFGGGQRRSMGFSRRDGQSPMSGDMAAPTFDRRVPIQHYDARSIGPGGFRPPIGPGGEGPLGSRPMEISLREGPSGRPGFRSDMIARRAGSPRMRSVGVSLSDSRAAMFGLDPTSFSLGGRGDGQRTGGLPSFQNKSPIQLQQTGFRPSAPPLGRLSAAERRGNTAEMAAELGSESNLANLINEGRSFGAGSPVLSDLLNNINMPSSAIVGNSITSRVVPPISGIARSLLQSGNNNRNTGLDMNNLGIGAGNSLNNANDNSNNLNNANTGLGSIQSLFSGAGRTQGAVSSSSGNALHSLFGSNDIANSFLIGDLLDIM